MAQWNDPNTQAWIDQHEQLAIRHSVDVGDHQVSWRQYGDASGEPLLLIHGGHGSWMHWARNIDTLAEKFSLFVVDLPGYGDSSDPMFGEFGDLLTVTEQSITQLLGANTPFQLSGFSFGGLVSANLAARGMPVKSLAILGPGGHGGPRRERGKLVNWKRAVGDEELREAMRFNLWAHMLYADEAIDPFALDIHTYSCVQTRFRSRGISGRDLLGPALDDYSGQTLIVWGAHDITCEPEYLMANMIEPHANRKGIILPEMGHWVQYEAAEQTNAIMLDWFKQK
jgi:pimeloyl-ACP methyl ester carboxylesterase